MTQPPIGFSLVYSLRLGSKSNQRLVTAIPLGPFSTVGPVCQLVVIIVIVLVVIIVIVLVVVIVIVLVVIVCGCLKLDVLHDIPAQ